MASRRKNSKPTNKPRKVLPEEDQDDDGERDDFYCNDTDVKTNLKADSSTSREYKMNLDGSLSSTPGGIIQTGINHMTSQTMLLHYQAEDDRPSSSASQNQNIALPIDIVQDFEALKCATNLDSSQLIRKLLKDYQMLADAHPTLPRENRHGTSDSGIATHERDVTTKSNPADILDLSVHKQVDKEQDEGVKYRVLTDDQIAMGNFNVEEFTTPATALDLTVPRNDFDPVFARREMNQVDATVRTHVTSSLFSASFPTLSYTTHESLSASKHSDMYVVNLEPKMRRPVKSPSPHHWESIGKALEPTVVPPQRTEASTKCAKSDVETALPTHYSFVPIERDDRFPTERLSQDTCSADLMTSHARAQCQSPYSLSLSLPSSSVLPSYSQAISLSNFMLRKDAWPRLSLPVTKNNLLEDSCGSSRLNNADGKHVSVLQVKPGSLERRSEESISKISISDVAHHTVTSGCKILPQTRHDWPISTNSNLTTTTSVACSVSPLPSSFQISCPNFLIGSQLTNDTQETTSTPILATVQPAIADTSLTGAMQLPAIIMAAGSDGVMGNVLAIPIFQGTTQESTNPTYSLPSNTTGTSPVRNVGLPSIMTTSVAVSSIPSVCCDFGSMSTSDQMSHYSAGSSANISELSSSDKLSASKSVPNAKPATDNSTTAIRMSSEGIYDHSRNVNAKKNMKLLTENALFPGVYTSILKLPWSKRTRNTSKSKAKPDKQKRHNKTSNTKNQLKNNGKKENNEIEGKVAKLHSDSHAPPCSNSCNQNYLDNSENMASDIQSKDFEQQKRLHHQYHLRLQEERQILKRDFESSSHNDVEQHISHKRAKSYCPRNELSPSFKPVDSDDQSDVQSEIRHNVMLSSASLASVNDLPPSNGLDPIMLVYPNVGPTTSPKSRRRGRPPKTPIMSAKISSESSLFQLDSVFSSVDSHSESTLFPSITTSMPATTLTASLLSPDAAPTVSSAVTTFICSNDKSHCDFGEKGGFPETTCDNAADGQMSLEKKINYLANQIEIEMAENRTKTNTSVDLAKNNEVPQSNGQKLSKDLEIKTTENGKTRRKKTSRMLKSNENFIYATFRFKPRGSHAGAKRSTRKSKDTSATTAVAAAAETIACLRDKRLKGSIGNKSKGKSQHDPLIHAWKFHEQYPYFPNSPKLGANVTSASNVCLSCGAIFEKATEQTHCASCLPLTRKDKTRHKTEDTYNLSPKKDNHLQSSELKRSYYYSNEQEESMDDISTRQAITDTIKEIPIDESASICIESRLQTSCVKCLKTYLKGYGESGVQCPSCKQQNSSVINSSKLFSLAGVCKMYEDNSEMGNVSPSQESLNFDLSADSNNSQKGNSLFCSTCRMQFPEISCYLKHIEQTHVKCGDLTEKADGQSPSTSTTGPHGRKGKSSAKNKKSLAHKTITCPVEDCPLFFRHQRDMDFHLKKTHNVDTLLPAISSDVNKLQSLNNENQTYSAVEVNFVDSVDEVTDVVESGLGLGSGSSRAESISSSQEKPLQCDICDFRCRQKNALSWHMRKHPEVAWQHRRYSSMNSD